MEIVAPIALVVAFVTGIGAAFMLWTSQTAARAGRGALFNTERQVAIDRAKRSRMSALTLGLISIALIKYKHQRLILPDLSCHHFGY